MAVCDGVEERQPLIRESVLEPGTRSAALDPASHPPQHQKISLGLHRKSPDPLEIEECVICHGVQ